MMPPDARILFSFTIEDHSYIRGGCLSTLAEVSLPFGELGISSPNKEVQNGGGVEYICLALGSDTAVLL